MNNFMKKGSLERVINRVVDLKFEADNLPPLPANEEAKIENAIAIDHLYYSSAMEGSRLNNEQITLVTHEGVSTPEQPKGTGRA